MSVKYNIDDITLTSITINGVSNAFKKLIENDQTINDTICNNIDVWECKWFNNNKMSGYPRGTAVWVNTEDVDQFIRSRYDDIEQYILKSQYDIIYSTISSNTTETIKLFRNVCLGTNGYKQLYYLGDVTQCAQIKVSLSDDNKELPSNPDYWSDSFRLSSEIAYEKEISVKTDNNINKLLEYHVNNYHLSGVTVSELTSQYLLNDFSNISKKQEYQTHSINGRNNIETGFDTIIKNVRVTNTNSKESRWFRLWSSGLLEHGGIISANSDELVSINLNWKYDNLSALIYDYPRNDKKLYADDYTISGNVEINPQNIGPQLTYNVMVSPICTTGDVNYNPIEVINIVNGGFQFVNNGSNCMYSYYTSGYVTALTLNRYLV